jgi:hypothetical protein
LCVGENQLPSPPWIRGSTAAKYSRGILASRAAVVLAVALGRGVLGGRLLVELGAEPPSASPVALSGTLLVLLISMLDGVGRSCRMPVRTSVDLHGP